MAWCVGLQCKLRSALRRRGTRAAARTLTSNYPGGTWKQRCKCSCTGLQLPEQVCSNLPRVCYSAPSQTPHYRRATTYSSDESLENPGSSSCSARRSMLRAGQHLVGREACENGPPKLKSNIQFNSSSSALLFFLLSSPPPSSVCICFPKSSAVPTSPPTYSPTSPFPVPFVAVVVTLALAISKLAPRLPFLVNINHPLQQRLPSASYVESRFEAQKNNIPNIQNSHHVCYTSIATGRRPRRARALD